MNRGELSKAFAEGKTLQKEKTSYMFTCGPFTKQNQFQPFIYAVGIALSLGHFNLITPPGKPQPPRARAPLRH